MSSSSCHTSAARCSTLTSWSARRGLDRPATPGSLPLCFAPKHLLRDRDGVYGQEFQRRAEVLGLKELRIAPDAPWQSPYVERLIGSLRRECLDHVIVLNPAHLRRVLENYLGYYHRSRTHLDWNKDAPEPRPVQGADVGEIVAFPQVGGLHHRYERGPPDLGIPPTILAIRRLRPGRKHHQTVSPSDRPTKHPTPSPPSAAPFARGVGAHSEQPDAFLPTRSPAAASRNQPGATWRCPGVGFEALANDLASHLGPTVKGSAADVLKQVRDLWKRAPFAVLGRAVAGWFACRARVEFGLTLMTGTYGVQMADTTRNSGEEHYLLSRWG